MDPGSLIDESSSDRESMLRALVLMHRFTLDTTRIAASTLGHHRSSNTDVQVLLAVHRNPGASPGQLGVDLGLARTAVSRALGHLCDDGLIERRTSPSDARSSRVHLTRSGRARVSNFDRALDDCFAEGAPMTKEVLDIVDVPPTPRDVTVSGLDVISNLGRAGSAYADEVTSALLPYGLNDVSSRFAIALMLDRGEVRPSHLAHDLDLSTSGASDLLDRLEGAGLVVRSHADPTDRRAVVVRLTELGLHAANVQLDVFTRHAVPLCQALAWTVVTPSKELA